MIAKNCTVRDLNNALATVNEKFGGNIVFKKISPAGRHIRFTLTVKSSKGSGARLGAPNHAGKQRRIAAACWHVHGEFFDALPPSALIVARGEKIHPGDPWKDSNIGSQYRPMYFSQACECE